jgi:hypothetical protein
MKKNILILIVGAIIFCGLVYYNYQLAQKKIKDTRPAPLSISLQTYPEKVIVGQSGTFIWNVDSSPDLYTPRTTIYYGYFATPSALTTQDSPEAVNYAFQVSDYYNGTFKLPDSFEESIVFKKAGKIYFRAYAKVGDNHLWTEEKSLEVISNN